MSVLSDYNATIERRRRDRKWLSDDHKNKRREQQWEATQLSKLKIAARAAAHKRLREYDHEAEQRQRLQDMCEDSGLVFCLPSLNPYSGE